MARKGFSVTYETITPESAAEGDAEDRGYIVQNVSLKDAMGEIGAGGEEGAEANCYPITREHAPRWITFYKWGEDYRTGEVENRSLHIPDWVTPASRIRIARLVRCYGVR